MEIIKTWCTRCNKTYECFITEEKLKNTKCSQCNRQCLPATHEIHIICPSCTREIVREKGLEPVGGTQAGAHRLYSDECKCCKNIVTKECEVLKKFKKID